MMTSATNSLAAQANGGRFPRDVSAWIDKKALAALVQDSVHMFYWVGPSTLGDTLDPPGQAQRVLLAVLTFCYASGVYASAHVLQLLETDRLTCSLCGPGALDNKTILLFRGQNRELLKRCLAYVLQRAWSTRTQQVDGTEFTSSVHRPMSLGASWQRQLFQEEAEARIEAATDADRLLLAGLRLSSASNS